ncbi:hypothetical protein [Thalassotalea loyana]|nr:hypothetical protein [Thalassotalea loyana]
MMIKKHTALAISISTLFSSPAALANTQDSDWELSFEPYLQATAIQGDATIGRVGEAPVHVEFSDILDTLDNGIMFHGEAYNKATHWGIALDYAYMDLRDSANVANTGTVSARVRQGVLEALAFKRFEYGDHIVDYFGGIRWWDNDISASISSEHLPGDINAEHDEDWVDAVIGARYWYSLNKDWKLNLRADVGGFGLESDFTSVVYAGAEYKATDSISIKVGYKATWVDYKNDQSSGEPGHFEYDTVTKGPVLGAVFKF